MKVICNNRIKIKPIINFILKQNSNKSIRLKYAISFFEFLSFLSNFSLPSKKKKYYHI